ncbi:hypothetical protein IL306_001371 [Fusarium sp. DS 682]|nr:hypothetical protein IL306_001371 [Fusarium sp. DS 682]
MRKEASNKAKKDHPDKPGAQRIATALSDARELRQEKFENDGEWVSIPTIEPVGPLNKFMSGLFTPGFIDNETKQVVRAMPNRKRVIYDFLRAFPGPATAHEQEIFTAEARSFVDAHSSVPFGYAF